MDEFFCELNGIKVEFSLFNLLYFALFTIILQAVTNGCEKRQIMDWYIIISQCHFFS